jgi:acyl transferase domain-containing protein
MGRALYETHRVFREVIDHCAALLETELGLDIRDVLYPDAARRDEAAQLLARTFITQPAIFMVSYATARVFLDLGLQPQVLIGHSVGEYVAAVIAEVMTLEQALLAVAFRGRLIYALPKGSMLAVLKSEAELAGVLPDTLDVAVINSPELVVVSGPDEEIAQFAARMAQQKVFTKRLPTSHAFHSRMMAPSLDAYREHFRRVTLRAPRIPIISTVTGKPMTAEQATDHEYWVQHVVDPVRFADAARAALTHESLIFVECGPGHSLESAIRRQLPAQATHAVISTLKEGDDALAAVDAALAKLWVEEHVVNLARHFGSEGCRKVPFPLLPFARTRYSIDFSANASVDAAEKNPRKPDPASWYSLPAWRRTPAVAHVPRLERAQVDGEPVWLVFVADALGEQLASTLRARGQRCVAVRRGAGYRRDGDEATLDPAQRANFDALLRALPGERSSLRVVYGWTHTPGSGGALGLDDIDATLELAFHALVRLERSLIEHAHPGCASLLILADDAFDVSGGGAVRSERALALGPARTLFKEHSEFCSRFINIESRRVTDANRAGLVDELLAEALIDTDEALVSYAGTMRWTECFEPLALEPPAGLLPRADGAPPALKQGGVYLVTGGAGGIGRTCSHFIAERVRAHFVWTSRTPLPPRAEWDALIAAQRDDALVERLRAIRAIEALGSSVHCHAVESSDLDGMRRMRDEVEAQLGPVCGIVHAAGIAGGGVIALRDEAEFDAVLRPKVHGSLVLHALFGDRPLDFIHFCSSVTALFGEAGRIDYTSANAFMDALCQSGAWRNAARATSINWCEWALVGMGAAWESEKLRRKPGARARRADALPAATPGRGPDLRMLDESTDASVFRIDIDPARHWILAEHLLVGQPTMVGTSYLDTLRRWAGQRGSTQLTVRGATFASPLIAMGGATPELRLQCHRDGNGWRFAFSSSLDGNDWKEHFTGRLATSVDAPALPLLTDCLARCAAEPRLQRHFTSVADANGNLTLHYSERWDCLEALYLGDDEWVARLELPERFGADLDLHNLHPALLDVATSCHFSSMPQYQDTYLPYSYGELVMLAPFTRTLHVWGRPSPRQPEDAARVSFDFVLYDADARPVLLLRDYTLTRVGNAGVDAARGRKAQAATATKIDAILPDEGKQVFARLLEQDLPQVIVHPQDFQLEFDETRLSRVRRKLQEALAARQQAAQADDRPELGTDFTEPEDDIERTIAAIWSAILGVRRIGANDAFNELGGNSLLAIQVIAGIGEAFDVEIKASEFMGSASVRALANLILAKILESQDEGLLQELLAEQEGT